MTTSDPALLRAGLVVTADLLTVAANWPYIQAVRARVLPARPRLVTWLVFTAATAVPAIGSFRAGDWPDGAFLTALAAGCLGVLVTGWRYGSRHVGWFGGVCLALGAAGVTALAISVVRPAAVTAMQVTIISVATDFVAFLPTYAHGWLAPDEEPPRPWALFTIGSALTLVASLPGSAGALLWPAYLVVADGFMFVLVQAGRERDRRSSLLWRRGQLGRYHLLPETAATAAGLNCRSELTAANGALLPDPGPALGHVAGAASHLWQVAVHHDLSAGAGGRGQAACFPGTPDRVTVPSGNGQRAGDAYPAS